MDELVFVLSCFFLVLFTFQAIVEPKQSNKKKR